MGAVKGTVVTPEKPRRPQDAPDTKVTTEEERLKDLERRLSPIIGVTKTWGRP